MEIYYCPICGYGPFEEPYESIEELRYSYDICPCCGCEYGYDDHDHYFENWVTQGAKWFNQTCTPEGWTLEEQLTRRIRPWPPQHEI